MEVFGIVLGVIGVVGTVYFGLRSRQVNAAFARYVQLGDEVARLQESTKDYPSKIRELETLKANVYRHKYEPKSKVFVPGDRVRLIKIPKNRAWISKHSKKGMTGIVVDYGPGTYEYTVYWSEADYEGEPIDDIPSRWQSFYVNREEIERLT
jgi:hypothetical protein